MATYQHLGSQSSPSVPDVSRESTPRIDDEANNESCESEDDDIGKPETKTERKPTKQKKPAGSGRAWEPGVLKRFPWSAGAAWLIALLCTIACAAILVVANNKPKSLWKVSPSVLLAIFSAMMNASLSYALAEAVNYRWWIQSVKGRSSLNDLQRLWMAGTSVGAALTSGKQLSLMALASIAVTTVAIDGPLLQRAISTYSRDVNMGKMPINVTLADQIPLGYSGFAISTEMSVEHSALSPILLSGRFQQVVNQYQQREPITISSLTGCHGICTGELEGAGLHVACEPTTIEPLNVTASHVASNRSLFEVSFAWSGDLTTSRNHSHAFKNQRPVLPVPEGRPSDEPFIHMNITWSPNGTYYDTGIMWQGAHDGQTMMGYAMFVHQSKCRLYPGSASYPVRIKNGVVSTAAESRPVVNNTIELKEEPKFIPGSYQNTRKLVVDGIDHLTNMTSWEWQQSGIDSWDTEMARDTSDLAMYPYSPDIFGSGKDSFFNGTLAGLALYLQNVFGSQVNFRNGRYSGSMKV